MKRFAGAFFAALLLATVLSIGMNRAVISQTYPTTTPVYIPTAVLGTQTLTTTGASTAYNVNGQGTMLMRVLGTNSGLVATAQVTESKQTSPTPTWSSVSVEKVGGVRQATISGNGLYRINVAGAGQVRLNITTLSSGNVALTMAAAPAGFLVTSYDGKRATYSAAILAHAPAASATSILSITGNATTTVRVTKLECSALATAISTYAVQGAVYSTAQTGGTPAAVTAVPNDSTDAAALATVQTWAGGLPTLGTLTGIVRADYLQMSPAATTTYGAQKMVWRFGDVSGSQEVVLRGTGQVFALDGNATSVPSGGKLSCALEWTEE